MDDWMHLEPAKHGLVLRVLESVPAVKHRGDWFLWSQGAFQGLLPHGLLCGVLLSESWQPQHLECLQSVPVDEAVMASLRGENEGAIGLARVAQAMQAEGLTRLQWPFDPAQRGAASEGLQHMERAWQAYRLGGCLFQLSADGVGSEPYLFAMMLMPEPVAPAGAALLEVFAPQLQVMFNRVMRQNRAQTGALSDEEFARLELTERQLEILHWVKLGKTNFEIAQIVGISDLTVKNHLQKVFKRLNVHNRAQAVAQLMSVQRV